MKQKGFTLVELMVVIAIIGLLSSVVLVSLNSARAKARDARRMQDLAQIKTALNLYYDKTGNWIEIGSGCGYIGDGEGYFNYVYPGYKSIAQCLIDSGVMSAEIIDPTGGRMSSDYYAYMKYTRYGTTYLYANLETLDHNDSMTDGSNCGTCDSVRGMNYYIRVD